MKRCVRCSKKILGRRRGLRITSTVDPEERRVGLIHRSCVTKAEVPVLTIGTKPGSATRELRAKLATS